MRFLNKVCLVTGGNSGIGKATCLQFAKEGADIIIVGLKIAEGKKVVREIEALARKAIFIQTDISKESQIRRAVKKGIAHFNKIDVLVNNAGMMTFTPLVRTKTQDWDKLMHVNLRAAYLFCRYCYPVMKKGAIINVSSVHAHETTANVIPYAISKAGLEALTRGLSQEYKPSKFRVNSVAPGAIDTDMLWSNPNIKSGKEKLKEKVGKPEDVANAICFLASDEASYINGTTLVIDNGKLNVL
jgi:glucose 1-dehydrogenase